MKTEIPNPSPTVAEDETAVPTLVSLGSHGGILTKKAMEALLNGSFMCRRYTPIRETFAVKVNGLLIPTTRTNAEACELIAKGFGGTTAAWCKAWALVQKVANQPKEEPRK